MARIRTIKPEFWSSPGLPTNPWERLLFVAMWNWADDYGIGSANERELLGFAFPNDDQITIADLRRMLTGIRCAFGVKFYTVGGRPYYAIPSWEDHQKIDRRAARRNPGPDAAETQLYTESPPPSPRVPAGPVPICHESPRSDPDATVSHLDQRPPTSPRKPPEDTVGSRGVSGVGKGTEDLGKGTEEEEPPYPPEREPSPPQPPTRKTGDEIARSRFGAIPAAPSASARDVAAAYSASLVVPLEPKLLGQVSGQIDQCLRGNIPPDAIAAGLGAWTRSDSWAPSQIPNFVHKAANGRATNGIAKPTEKALDYGTVAEQVIAALEPKP